jgi:hypothetical protein
MHVAVEGREKRVLVPIYLHVDVSDGLWWRKKHRTIKADLVRVIAENIREIEGKYYDISAPEGDRVSAGSSSMHSSMVLSYSHAPIPSRLEGSEQCIIAYAVSPNSKYSLLTVSSKKKDDIVLSEEFLKKGTRESSRFEESSIASFIVSCWIYPRGGETSGSIQRILPIFA